MQVNSPLSEELAKVRIETESLKKKVDRLLENLTAANREFIDEKLLEIRQRMRELEWREEELYDDDVTMVVIRRV